MSNSFVFSFLCHTICGEGKIRIHFSGRFSGFLIWYLYSLFLLFWFIFHHPFLHPPSRFFKNVYYIVLTHFSLFFYISCFLLPLYFSFFFYFFKRRRLEETFKAEFNVVFTLECIPKRYLPQCPQDGARDLERRQKTNTNSERSIPWDEKEEERVNERGSEYENGWEEKFVS